MKNIIVPVDFSEESISGLQIALLFAKKIPVTVQLVYVMQKVSEHGNESVDTEHDFAEKQLKALVEKYSPGLHTGFQTAVFHQKGKDLPGNSEPGTGLSRIRNNRFHPRSFGIPGVFYRKQCLPYPVGYGQTGHHHPRGQLPRYHRQR